MAQSCVRVLLCFLVLIACHTLTWAQGTRHINGFTFEWDARSQSEAQALMARAPQHKTRIYGELGVKDAPVIRVVVAESRAAMLEKAESENGHRPPEWAAGLAYPRKGHIYLHASVHIDELEETFIHELSHVALGRVADSKPIPRWFSEGLAIWQSESFSWERMRLLTEAASMDRLFRLAQLERGFPSNAHRAGVAYAQAVHFVGYLHQIGGQSTFHTFIDRLRRGDQSFQVALESSYETSLRSLERDWLNTLRVRWGWVSVIFNENSLWIFASVLLIIGWRRRSKEKKRRLVILRAFEDDEAVLRDDVHRSAGQDVRRLGSNDGQPPTYH
ncbi:MAG: peptidase MA family metallohydrolase [Myxococcota bacterium]|nr:peptidase MA family metallohydrolase [Myxococcota bacterium]